MVSRNRSSPLISSSEKNIKYPVVKNENKMPTLCSLLSDIVKAVNAADDVTDDVTRSK